MKRIFVWGTLRHNGCNNASFLSNAKLVEEDFLFHNAPQPYMKVGDIYEVTDEELKRIDQFEEGFLYKSAYDMDNDFYYYLGREVSPTGMFI